MSFLLRNRRKILCFASVLTLAWMSVGVVSQLAVQAAAMVERIVIEKKKRTLELMAGAKTDSGAKWGWLAAKHTIYRLDGRLHRRANEEIDEIYLQIQVGTPVDIRP